MTISVTCSKLLNLGGDQFSLTVHVHKHVYIYGLVKRLQDQGHNEGFAL